MLKVLLVEDSEAKMQEVRDLILESGFVETAAIECVRDAFAARLKLKEETFDLLVLDLVLPERAQEQANPETAMRLVDDLFEGEDFRMPRQIIGLTAFGSLHSSYARDFVARGLLLVHFDQTSDSWRAPLMMQLRQRVAQRRAEANSDRDYGVSLGLVCSLDIEFDAVQRLPWHWKDVEIQGDPAIYSRGIIPDLPKEREVIATLSPRMGMSAASIAATKLISEFHPRHIAVVGITAGLRGQVNIGDVIVADEVWDWGMGKWAHDSDEVVFLPGPHHLSIDAAIRAQMHRLSRDEPRLARIRAGWPGTKPLSELRVLIGPMASGAAVIAAQKMTDRIASYHRKLIGIEMEAYGVFAAAADGSRPITTALAVKGVSDFADEHKGDNWQAYAAYASVSILNEWAVANL